ncbi:MAG: gluconeogenesis factor YvcK family protein [Terriglobia bacterium]
MRIVAIGGGTGLSTLLQGLKKYTEERTDGAALYRAGAMSDADARRVSDLTAVVTVADDGGSSGRLRREFQVLPPGDIRNCMVALSEDAGLLSRLFQFRFSGGRGLKGHSFGNLFLTALTAVTGDFQEAVKLSGEVLAIRGRIFPSTMADIRLEAVMEDGRLVQGESRISRTRGRIARIRLAPASCRPLPQTLEAIEQADVITVGPGSLFTSVVPNLLVEEVAPAIARSRAVKIYIANLMTQPGETAGFTASDHLRTIEQHCGLRFFNVVLLNSAPIPLRLQRRYLAERSRPVEIDLPQLMEMNLRVVTADLVLAERPGAAPSKWVRHDPDRLAKAVMGIASRHLRRLSARRRQKAIRRQPIGSEQG